MEDENDESWLYGNTESQSEQPEVDEEPKIDEEENDVNNQTQPEDNVEDEADGALHTNGDESNLQEVNDSHEMEDSMHEAFHEDETAEIGLEAADAEKEAVEKDDEADSDSDDDDDDDINVVIGDIKSGPTYNIKTRGTALAAPNAAGAKQPTGKFSIEEFESVGMVAGVPAHEFSIDSLDEKPWRKPGADITDYFNYGFNEDTWRAYCERQKHYRVQESGVGLAGLSQHVNQPVPNANGPNPGFQSRPPFRAPFRRGGHIDVIGNNHNRREPGAPGSDPPTPTKQMQPKENIITVMTAERREYSRMNRGGFGMDDGPPPQMPENTFYEGDQFNYMSSYEPTQDSQWMGSNPGWGPASGIKELTPGPNMMTNMPPPGMPPGPMGPMPPMGPMGGPMAPNIGPPMMNMPPHMNAPPNQNSPRGYLDKGDRRDMRGGPNDRGIRRRSRSRSRSRERSRRPRSRSLERAKRFRSRSRERSRRPRSRSRERSKRPRSRSRDRKRSKSKEKDRKRSKSKEKDRKKDRKDDKKDKEKDKKSHKKDKSEKEGE